MDVEKNPIVCRLHCIQIGLGPIGLSSIGNRERIISDQCYYAHIRLPTACVSMSLRHQLLT